MHFDYISLSLLGYPSRVPSSAASFRGMVPLEHELEGGRVPKMEAARCCSLRAARLWNMNFMCKMAAQKESPRVSCGRSALKRALIR